MQSSMVKGLGGKLLGPLVGVLCLATAVFAQDKIKIGVVDQADIKPFFDATDGIKKALADNGLGDDKVEFIVFSAKGNIDTIKDGVAQLKASGVKLIVAMGTMGAIETLKYAQEIPVVFSAVSYGDIVSEAARKNISGTNFTGTTLNAPAEMAIDIAMKITKIEKMGCVYHSTEENAVKDKDNFEKGAAKFGIPFVAVPYADGSELIAAYKSLITQGIKCIVLPKDVLVQKYFDELKPLFYDNHILVVGVDAVPVQAGVAYIALTAPPFKVGELAGTKIYDILINGKKASDVPIEGLSKYEIWINLAAASKAKIDMPMAVVKLANKVITE